MRVREFESRDFEAAYRLDQSCYPPGIAYSRFALAAFLADAGAHAWVAQENNQLVGFVIVRRVRGQRGHVITLDVHEGRRRQGVGRALLDTAERWLIEQGVKRVQLETAVDNPATAFWQRMGYENVGVLVGYYLGRQDAYRMEKRLSCG